MAKNNPKSPQSSGITQDKKSLNSLANNYNSDDTAYNMGEKTRKEMNSNMFASYTIFRH